MRVRAAIVAVSAAAVAAGLTGCGTETGSAAPIAVTGPSSSTAMSTTSSPAPSTTAAPSTTTTPPAPPAPPVTSAPPPKPKPKPTVVPKPRPKPGPVAGTPCTNPAVSACIDLSANRSWLLNGKGTVILGPVPITHGRPGYRTPVGTFRVGWKDIDHLSSEFDNAPMPYSVFFNGGIAFHAGSLTQQSHGCIHLSTSAAKTYYNNLAVGEIVQVVP